VARVSVTRWFWIRVALAVGVVALLAVELAGHRTWYVVALQAVLIVGIVLTSAADLREIRHGATKRGGGPP